MKRFLLSLGLFVLFAFVFYWAALIVAPGAFKMNLAYQPGSLGFMNTRTKEIDSVGKIDLLFLGSSHAYRGFDTRIFNSAGYRAFNLGSSIQTPVQAQVLLQQYLPILQPKMVVYEVSTIAFRSDGIESFLDLIANSPLSWSTVAMALEINNIKVYNTLLYATWKQLFDTYEKFDEKQVRGSDRYIPGGYVERAMERYRPEDHEPQALVFNQKSFDYLDKNLDYLKQRGVQVILVQAPITSSQYISYKNNNQFDSVMNSKDVSYYNFNERLPLNDSIHFSDAHHLNQQGVQVFNNAFIELLKSRQ